jgi:sulfate permease, SulP family
VLTRYSEELKRAGGRLYIAGVDPEARELIVRTGKVSAAAAERIFPATPVVGESTERAAAAGDAWLIEPSSASSPRDDESATGPG